MSTAYTLLSQVVGDAVARTVEPGMSLAEAGIGSGSLIRLVLLVEEHCDAALSAGEVDALSTLADIDLLIGRLTGGGETRPAKEATTDVDAATD